MTASTQEHSPLGGSGAYRWMPCPGSVGLSEGIDDPESEDAALGTAAHTLGALCLHRGQDAWEHIGSEVSDGKVGANGEVFWFNPDKNMADAVQVYLDAVREAHPDRDQGNTWIERRFHCPEIHKYFWGRPDLIHIETIGSKYDGKKALIWNEDDPTKSPAHLHVWDYKHGIGITVEVPNNPQLMYYACGVLEDLQLWDTVDEVTLHVAQPRGFHWAGPIREWTVVSVADLQEWLWETLVPAMDNALVSDELKSGRHCQFCPARSHACPQLMKDWDELEGFIKMIETKTKGAAELTNKQVGRFLDLWEVLKPAAKAARETGFARAEKGNKIPGWKLVKQKSNREWKDGAIPAALEKFGLDCLTIPKKIAFAAAEKFGTLEPIISIDELKSPAKIDKLPEGKAFSTRMAFKPDAGNTLVSLDDTRQDVGPDKQSMFEPQGKKKK